MNANLLHKEFAYLPIFGRNSTFFVVSFALWELSFVRCRLDGQTSPGASGGARDETVAFVDNSFFSVYCVFMLFFNALLV